MRDSWIFWCPLWFINLVVSVFSAIIWVLSEQVYQVAEVFLDLSLIAATAGDMKQIVHSMSQSDVIGFITIMIACALLIFTHHIMFRKLTASTVKQTKPQTWFKSIVMTVALALFLKVASKPVAALAETDIGVFPSELLVFAKKKSPQKVQSLNLVRLEKRFPLSGWSAIVAAAPKTPVIIIMLESIALNHLGFLGYERNTTPNLDELATNSILYNRMYATACHSNYAQTSIPSSQYAQRRTSLDKFKKIDYDRTTIYDLLQNQGYETYVISAQNENWQGMKRFITEGKEFTKFWHSADYFGPNIGAERKVDDHIVVQEAIETLEQRVSDSPFIMTVNFQKTHFPFELPVGLEGQWQPSNTDDFQFSFFDIDLEHKDRLINKYDNALAYVDEQVGTLIQNLKDKGLYNKAMIVVTSDHGESLFADGHPTHGTSLFDPQIKAFGLIKLPDQTDQVIVDEPVSAIDLAPTILSALNLPAFQGFQGMDLLGGEGVLAQQRDIFMTGQGVVHMNAVVRYPWKYIAYKDGRRMLFNLEEDPKEKQNIVDQEADISALLDQRLNQFLEQQISYYNGPKEVRDKYYVPKPEVDVVIPLVPSAQKNNARHLGSNL